MTSILNRGGQAVILAIAVLALGCESGTEPAGAPALQDSIASGLLSGQALEDGSLADGLLGSELSFANRTVAQLSDEVVRKKIDPDVGGELTLLGHTLTVPAGAVDRPTMFVMSVLAGTTIEVELIAYDPDLYDDVGGKGFTKHVTLALSYAEADIDDPESLTIVHIRTDGTSEDIPSEVDTEKKVVRAELSHFSRYALCGN